MIINILNKKCCVIKDHFMNYVCTVVTTLLLTNDTHDSDTLTITQDTRTITHDTRTITYLLNFHDTQTITIKNANERFYTIKHAKFKISFTIRIKKTYCFNGFFFSILVLFFLKAACTIPMRCFIFT